MAAKTYKVRALVLKKTKLREKDLIVTMLAQDGSLIKGVAKGARKPGGSFAARLELFSVVDVMLAQGRSLDVVCEVRLVSKHALANVDFQKSLCAAPLAELLCSISQPGLEAPRVFDMSEVAFERILAGDVDATTSAALLSASLWKVMAQVGYRPSFAHCSICSAPVEDDGAPGMVALSLADGGIVCDSCLRPADAFLVERDTVRWCDAFVRTRFDEIAGMGISPDRVIATLQLAKSWTLVHVGKTLKSLDVLFTSAVFGD